MTVAVPQTDATTGAVVLDDAFLARAKADPGEAFASAVVAALAMLPRAEYESWRARLKKSGVRGGELDKAVEEERAAQASALQEREAAERQAAAFAQEARRAAMPEPPVDLAELLHEIMTWLRRYVVLTDDQAVAISLWVAHTHAFDAADCTPYLQVTSATKRAGKSRLLEVLEPLVARSWFTERTTAAALVRKIDKEHSTLLLDESDTAFKGEKDYAEALRGLLNSGYRRSGRVTMCVGEGGNITVRDFATFAPKAIAGIGKLPDTVADRSIPIALRRRMKDEPCERWRERGGHQQAAPLKAQLGAWARGAATGLRDACPALPETLGDRQQDVCEPLMAIADLAGTDWPRLARQAVVALTGGVEDTDRIVELLSDIADILDKHAAVFIRTKDLIEKLIALEERPWLTWRHDKPITANGLAGVLEPLLIYPGPGPDGKSRGYRVDAFDDAMARYLPFKVSSRQNPNRDGPETSISSRQGEETIDTSKTAEASIKTGLFDGLTPQSPDQRPGAHARGQADLFPPVFVPDGPLEPVAAVDAAREEAEAREGEDIEEF